MTSGKTYVASVLEKVKKQNEHEEEFLQAVEEVFESLVPVFDRYPQYIEENLLERLVEPERVISFRVPWVDDIKVRFKLTEDIVYNFHQLLVLIKVVYVFTLQ